MLTRLLSLLSLGLVAALVGCGSSTPGQEEVRSVVEERLAQAFPEPVRYPAHQPAPPGLGAALGRRGRKRAPPRLLQRDIDASRATSTSRPGTSLNLAAFANLLGATEKGISA